MRRILDTLYLISGIIAALFIAGIVAIVFLQVCFNLIDKIFSSVQGSALGLTIPSYSDFTGFLLAGASFLALAYTLNSGGHIRVQLFIGLASKKIQRLLVIFILSVSIAIAGYAAWYMSLLVIESYQFGDMSSGMASIPLWIPQLPVAVGLIIVSIALLDNLVEVLRKRPAFFEREKESLMSE